MGFQEGVEERIPAFCVVFFFDALEDLLVKFLLLYSLLDQLLSYLLDLCLIRQQSEYIVLHVVVDLSDDFLGEVSVVGVIVIDYLLLRYEV